ncbi:formate dehydrogenase accessory protein FdhE [Anaeromyxobacter sp. Fw109-5]|uniref:formate dehydrogenase accessory protein FdhE n=1 Tax=Anaeromyxobacter sp. (strain Fw109-5) TaxID=404589 RepID=UPI0000ED8A45|nr:formate dehydrogenase accessory protein FdhE [Anaeromyxobacter sp. Fw109-5]ABS27238.1 putative formate dehydrogenase formation protein [Anaeromyxobacter sp. Fw109-5]
MNMNDASTKKWIEAHPYLEGVAAFQALVEAAAAQAAPIARRPAWDAYAADLAAGVPLLRSARAGLDVAPEGAAALRAVTAAVSRAALPPAIATAAKALDEALSAPRAAEAAIAWLVCGSPEKGQPEGGGLVRYLGWTALQRVLAPIVAEFDRWRDEERWRRGECPTCGSAPTMGTLVSVAEGRGRQLACGCCRTRWTFKRVACPFCDNEDANRLGVLELEQEPGLRLDVCEACKGYVKTYTGTRDLELVLSDWPTLHLDVLARDRGYRRLGTSLYELEGQGGDHQA